MKRFKKLTAGLMGVVMALGVCSFTAFAGDGDVAEINGKGYKTLGEAIEAARGKECTIEILDNIKESGFIAKSGDNFTIDFNGYTYTIDGTVGSTGTETNGMQLLKGSEITLKDGSVESDTAKILIQNYCNLTLMDMNLDGTGENCGYVISNNCGNTKIGGDTNITAKDGKVAFDLYFWPDNGYVDGVTVTFLDNMTGTVKGRVEYTSDNTKPESEWLENAKLTINNGTFDIEIDDTTSGNTANIEIVKGSFTSDVSDYMDANSKLLKDEEGNYVVMDDKAFEKSDKEFYISDKDDLKLAEEYQADGVTWVLAGDIDVSEMILITTDITIDGDNHTMTFTGAIFGNGGGKNSFIEIEKEADVEVKDLTLDGQSYEEGSEKVKHGFNVYTAKDKKASKLSLNNVKIKNCGGYAIVNNASEVEVKDIETSGNLWGGINVDNAVGAGTDGAKFTMVSGTIGEKNNGIKIENKNGSIIDAEIKDGKFEGPVYIADDVKNAELSIVSGEFSNDVSDYLAEGSHLVEDKDGNFVIMDEEEYDKKRPTHSYELEEGRVDRDDEEEEEPVVTTKPEEEAGPFSDVGKDNPNYDAIIKVYEKGWMAGIGDGVFAPNGTLTRAMGATVLWNKAGKPEPQNVAPFLDVTSDAWYAKAVAWAYEQGIVAGYGETFGPGDALTTEQFTRMNDIANGKTPEIYIGGAPNATRGWVASLLAM